MLYENYRTEKLSSTDAVKILSEIQDRDSKEKLEGLREKEKVIQSELESKMKERINIEEKLKS